MNAVEWSVLLGQAPTVTLHLIDAGIDTGPILSSSPVPIEPGDDLRAVARRALALGILEQRRIASEGIGQLVTADNAGGGRQCFVMAPALRELAELAFRRQTE